MTFVPENKMSSRSNSDLIGGGLIPDRDQTIKELLRLKEATDVGRTS